MSVKAYFLAAGAALALTAAAASPASAQSVSFNAGVVSDYVFRGFTQANEDPAVYGGVDLSWDSGFYLGAFLTNVDFGDSTDGEFDVYGGYRTEAAGYALDFGVVSYWYPGEPDGADYNFVELKAAASRAIGPATLGAAVYYSPDFYGADDAATYFEVNAAFTPAERWTLSGAVGHQWLDVSTDYLTWNAGVSYALTDNLSAGVRYHDTDVSGVPGAEDRVVFSLGFTF